MSTSLVCTKVAYSASWSWRDAQFWLFDFQRRSYSGKKNNLCHHARYLHCKVSWIPVWFWFYWHTHCHVLSKWLQGWRDEEPSVPLSERLIVTRTKPGRWPIMAPMLPTINAGNAGASCVPGINQHVGKHHSRLQQHDTSKGSLPRNCWAHLANGRKGAIKGNQTFVQSLKQTAHWLEFQRFPTRDINLHMAFCFSRPPYKFAALLTATDQVGGRANYPCHPRKQCEGNSPIHILDPYHSKLQQIKHNDTTSNLNEDNYIISTFHFPISQKVCFCTKMSKSPFWKAHASKPRSKRLKKPEKDSGYP